MARCKEWEKVNPINTAASPHPQARPGHSDLPLSTGPLLHPSDQPRHTMPPHTTRHRSCIKCHASNPHPAPCDGVDAASCWIAAAWVLQSSAVISLHQPHAPATRGLLPTWQRGPMSTRGIREETSPMPGLKASQLRSQWLNCCGLSWSHLHPIQTGSADCQGTDGRLWSVEFGPGTPLNPNVLGQFWRTSRSLPTRAACCHHSCVLQTAQTPDHPCPCV